MMYLTKLTLLSPPISILSRERYSRMDVDVAGINLLLDTPYYWSHRRAVMEFLATHPIFRKRDFTGMSVSEQRSLVMEQVRVFTQESGLFCFRDYWENPARWAATLEPVAYVGNNMLTKCGVLFSLFGATLAIVGSDYHRESLWKDVQTLKMRGCFCLTELGHGSDARSIETVAVLCAETKEFILNTPSDSAQKYWIGGLALHCSHGIVFAQLFVDGVNEGVHAFLVRLRDENNNVVSGVHIMDCGAKSGLNGVDNGRLWLTNVRIPRDALVDRNSHVGEDGRYVSEISSPAERFAKMIGQLVLGRIGVAISAISFAKLGLAIALRYAFTRKQFAISPGQPETPIIEYSSHQIRLIPLLAKTYAINLATNDITREVFMEMKKQGINLCQYLETMNKDLHVLASGIKPLSTWHRQRVLQTCRECCGGQGLLAANLIGNLMSDTEIDVTWEGDNSVLLQQVSLALLKDYGKLLKAKSAFAIFMEYYGFFRRNSISLSGYRVIDLYVTALAFRQKTLLMEAGSIFRDGAKLPRNPQNKLKVLNKCLPILLGLGIAHMEHEVLVRFKAIVEGGNNPILSKICLLSAVDVVNQNMAFYLEKQYFNSNDAGSMRQLLQELCAELQPNALQLIDAFKIHPNFLDAPIANDWLAANTKDRVPGDSSVKCDHRSKL